MNISAVIFLILGFACFIVVLVAFLVIYKKFQSKPTLDQQNNTILALQQEAQAKHLSDEFSKISLDLNTRLAQMESKYEVSTKSHSEQIINMVHEVRDKFNNNVQRLETLKEQTQTIANQHDTLLKFTNNMNATILNPNRRGQFGEMLLAQLLERYFGQDPHHIYYELQPQLHNAKGQILIPDAILFSERSGNTVIDAKFPLEGLYNKTDDNQIEINEVSPSKLKTTVRKQITTISKYLEKNNGIAKCVCAVMYIPVESFFIEISKHPELINEAVQERIIIISPSIFAIYIQALSVVLRYANISNNLHQMASLFQNVQKYLTKILDNNQKLQAHAAKADKLLASNVDNIKLIQTKINVLEEKNPTKLIETETLI